MLAGEGLWDVQPIRREGEVWARGRCEAVGMLRGGAGVVQGCMACVCGVCTCDARAILVQKLCVGASAP